MGTAARRASFALPDALGTQLRLSAQVLKTHYDKTFSGAMVASLSVPWGREERGGYHLVWPRDLAECARPCCIWAVTAGRTSAI